MAPRTSRKRTSPPSSMPPSEGSSQVDELVQRGLEAIEVYDFELAREALTRAFELSAGAEGPARALLMLLVDHLAADEEALGFGERLGRDAKGASDVRRLLALAAARSGAHERARGHMIHLEGRAAADVIAVLAEAALTSGDVDAAAGLCEEAQAYDMAHPVVLGLVRRIAQSREEVRRPLEDEIALALECGEFDEVRRLAEPLLARFPESAVARRALRVVLEAQRISEAAQRLAEAEWSLAEAGGDELRSSFHAARLAVAAAPPSEPLTRRLSALETEFGARERAAQIGDVVQLLAGPERRSALLRYAALSPEVRREVRERVRLSELNELEPLLGRRVDPLRSAASTVIGSEHVRQPDRACRRTSPV